MLKTLALLLPVYVTVFWVILLFSQKATHSIPRSYLAKLMFLLVILNLCRFFHRAPLPELYPYFDVIYLFVGTLLYPLYHIYFRLLTVDEKFSWKAHSRYLILPAVIGIVYLITVLATPFAEYKVWLFDRDAFPGTPQFRILKLLRLVVLIAIDLQAIYFLFRNIVLLKKYGDRAEQFYSNINDGKYNNAKILNYLLIFNCLIHVANALNIFNTDNELIIYSVLYAIDYYFIGYIGCRQKAINPTFVTESDNVPAQAVDSELNIDQNKIHKKLLMEFDKNKIYLNSELTIVDVVKVVGSNRMHISTMINQEYNQNFCTFVNGFRISELERIILDKKDLANEVIAESAGFGSVKSMKRAISSKTGLSLSEWKKQLLCT